METLTVTAWGSVSVYLKPGAMGCIRMLFSSKSSFHSRGHKCNSRVSIDTFVGEVSPMEQSAPVKIKHKV